MKRHVVNPRKKWQSIVESQGFTFHTLDDIPYWYESACYSFTAKQINVLEGATTELHEMCIAAAQYIIDHNKFHLLGIPEFIIPLIKKAWAESESSYWSLYGRFDFAYDGVNPPKMLEFNADTPTSLFEASVIQYYWLKDFRPKADQFNSIDEKLLAAWKFIHDKYRSKKYHFACLKQSGGRLPLNQLREDITTTGYILDNASKVKNLKYSFMDIGEVHWNGTEFVDSTDQPIETLFKLYPWEWMLNEEYGKYVIDSKVNWIEPIWKMLWSNKAILPILWKLFPNHPNLLPAFFEQPTTGDFVKKPKLSREGANVTIVKDGQVTHGSDLGYGTEGFVHQGLATLPCFDGNYPIIGSWIIGGEAAGMGIRESDTLITGNTSRFVPHYFE